MADARNPVRITCSACGSTEVSRDAWADWDEAAQQWVLGAVFDAAFCHRCECETSLYEEAVEASTV